MTRMSIKVLRGVGLIAKDRNWVSENSSDPYCKIYIDGHQIARTPVVDQTTDPIWGGPMSTFEFEGDEETTEVRVEIYNFCEFKRDGRMGQVEFGASAVLAASRKANYPNVWLPVQSLDGCRCSGELQIRLLRLPPEAKTGGARPGPGPRPATADASASIPTTSEDGPARPSGNELRESAITSLSAGPKLRAVGMGRNKASLKGRILSSRCPVTLHVYDVSNDGRVAKLNAVTKRSPGLHGGIFHAAVEVHGREYSFGGSRNDTTGIFACPPRKCPMHHYRESLFLGDCDLTPGQVDQILRKMKPEWMAPTYDLFRKNCCFFSKEFAIELGVGHIPEWIYSLADMGAAIDDYRIEREKAMREKEQQARIKEQQKASAEKKNNSNNDPPPTPCDAPRLKDSCIGGSMVGMEIIEIEGEIEISPSKGREETRDAPNTCAGALPKIRETSGRSSGGGEGIEIDDLVKGIETGMLDNVMAARVQRAYRYSVAERKRRDSMIPTAGVYQRQ